MKKHKQNPWKTLYQNINKNHRMPAQINLLKNAEIIWNTPPPPMTEKYVIAETEAITDTERLVFRIAHHFFKDVQQGIETFTYKYVVETFFANDIPKFYNRGGEYPLLSLVLFLEEGGKAVFTNDFSFDRYKLKDIQNLTNSVLCGVCPYKIVQYDPRSYAGTIGTSVSPMLLFHLWKKETVLRDVLPFSTGLFELKNNFNIDAVPIENRVSWYEADVETMIYEKTGSFGGGDDTYFSTKPNEDRVVFVKEKYGEDLLPFLDKDKYCITQENPFYKNRIYKKTFSTDVCYWMMNEYEKHAGLVVPSPYRNYQNCLKIDLLPSLFSFVSFVSNHLLDRAQIDYGVFEKRLNIQKTDMFLCKYTGKSTFHPSEDSLDQPLDLAKDLVEDGSFLSLNVVLNDPVDYVGNEIVFENMIEPGMIREDNTVCVSPESFSTEYRMEQGDMVIYNGNTKRTNGRIVTGSKYVLVLMTKLQS